MISACYTTVETIEKEKKNEFRSNQIFRPLPSKRPIHSFLRGQQNQPTHWRSRFPYPPRQNQTTKIILDNPSFLWYYRETIKKERKWEIYIQLSRESKPSQPSWSAMCPESLGMNSVTTATPIFPSVERLGTTTPTPSVKTGKSPTGNMRTGRSPITATAVTPSNH